MLPYHLSPAGHPLLPGPFHLHLPRSPPFFALVYVAGIDNDGTVKDMDLLDKGGDRKDVFFYQVRR